MNFVLALTIHASENKPFELNLISGVNVGWWGHNKGKDPAGKNIGWSRSRTNPKMPFEIQFWHQLPKKIALGISADYSIFTTDYLVDSESTRQRSKTVDFSEEEYVTLWSAKLMGRYALLQNKKIQLGPMLGLGYGNTLSTHPDQSRFKKNIAYTAGFYVNWNFHEHFAMVFQPNYEVLQIFPEQRNPGEQHRLSFFGVKLGLAWRI